MTKTTYKNETIKRRYFSFLEESKGFSQSSINSFEHSILLWEDYTQNADFGSFGKKRAIGFKKFLKEHNRSEVYRYHILRRLRTFFEWLSLQAGYKSKVNPTNIEFLNLSKQETRIALQPSQRKMPSMDEVKQVIESIKIKTEVDQRDRALISLTLLTGARITAISSLPLKSFDEKEMTIYQDPKLGVRTKFSKRIVSALIPISYDKPIKYFLDWINFLKTEKKFKPTDPIFPVTKLENGKENINFQNTGKVKPVFWQDSNAARKIFEKRFKEAGVPYYHPHSLRHLVVKEFTKMRLTEEEKKAISQNMGHENIGTTFGSYGYGMIAEDRQVELVKNINRRDRESEPKYVMSEAQLNSLIKKAQEK